jgi:O-acetyl-ADP-ribose deacetylase (regulator of RNase III)
MITEQSGNLLTAPVDALVNTVNTVGVMGKGIALQFKMAYPAMFADYERAAKAGEVVRGRIHVWSTGALDGPQYILNFPTKGHWRGRSRLADIEAGLADLTRVIRELGIRSVALPPLGCGQGGLDWCDVAPRIRAAFAELPEVQGLLFAPSGAPAASRMPNATARPGAVHDARSRGLGPHDPLLRAARAGGLARGGAEADVLPAGGG